MILDPKTVDDYKANREEWATALESGRFQQGRRVLFDANENRYCCLGVLCELVDPMAETWEGAKSFPPVSALKVVALPQANRSLINSDLDNATNELTYLNDGDAHRGAKSFPEIAAYIRELPLPTEVPS